MREDKDRDLGKTAPSVHQAGPGERSRKRILTTAELLAEPDEAETMLVEGQIPAAQAGLLAGDGRTGKTLLTLQLARARARGETFLGRAAEPEPSLLCLCDDARGLTKQRVRQMFTAEDQIFWFVERYDSGAYDEIAAIVAHEKPRLVVIDTLAMIIPNVPNAENDPATMKGVMEPYTRWANDGITVLFLHHTNAQGGIRGCTGIKDNVHFVLKLINAGLDEDTSRLVAVEVDWKYTPVKPFLLRHDSTGFSMAERCPTEKRSAMLKPVLFLVGQDKVSIAMILERARENNYKLSDPTVRREVKDLVKNGLLVDLGPDPDYAGSGTAPHLFGRAAHIQPTSLLGSLA